MPPRGRTPADASADAPSMPMEVDAPIEEPASPAPVGDAWVPRVRRQHLELEVGVTRGKGGLLVGCSTITCRPPPAGSGDVRLVMLHAHELLIDRVTIDGAPGRVVRRGRVVVGDDGKDVEDSGAQQAQADADANDPSTAKTLAETSDPITCATAAAEGAQRDTHWLDSGVGDELVLARRDGGTIASSVDDEKPNSLNDDASAKTQPDVVIKVWYAAGPGAGDALPDSWRFATTEAPVPSADHEFGWSVPGAGAVATAIDDDDETARFLVAPGSAARPSGWFPCVDDGQTLVHFSLGVTCERDLTVVAPGVLIEESETDVGEDDGGGTNTTKNTRERDLTHGNATNNGVKRFLFASGGIPTQAHQVTLVVGKFITRNIANSNNAVSAFAAAVGEDVEDDATHGDDLHELRELSTQARVAALHGRCAHGLFAPAQYQSALQVASGAVQTALVSFEQYLGKHFPYPGGAKFVFVPSDAMPTCCANAVGSTGGVHGHFPSAIIGAGVVVLSVDALAHPRSATDLVLSRNILAETAARLLFGGFLEPATENDAWLAEGLASHLAGRCVIARTLGGDEVRYRRAREAESVIAADDGVGLPPLASQTARVWRGGRFVRPEPPVVVSDEGTRQTDEGNVTTKELSDSTTQPPLKSCPPKPLCPEIGKLVRAKATCVIGMLERKLGEEGMRKVLRKLVSLQAKTAGAESLQEKASVAAKATRTAREKAKASSEQAAKLLETGADEAQITASNEKATQCARELLKREREEARCSQKLSESPARWLRSHGVLTLCRQNATMTKNEMAAFHARWIEGSGCPKLTVGFTFRKSRRQELLFAIELTGCPASAAGDRVAFRKNAKIAVTVRVQEADLPPSDHAVSLSAHDRAYCLMPLQLVTKPKDRRTIARQQQAALDRQQRAIEEGGLNPRSLDAAAAAEVLQWECPVQWVRVDPECEWLAEVVVPIEQIGLEGMLTAQLVKERPADVAAQLSAVAYLKKRAQAGSTSATRALLQCAEDDSVFCRVRVDAAVALSESARDGTQRSNLAHTGVTRAYRKRRCDAKTGLPNPSDLSNLAESVVDEGFVIALGKPREPVGVGNRGQHGTGWRTPVECVDLLVDALDHFKSDGDPMCGASVVSAMLASLGQTKPPTPVSLVSATHAIKRWLLRDAAVCGVGGRAHSGGRRVTVAGIHALKNLVVGFVASQETTTTTAAVPEPTTGRLGEVSGALAGKENNATTQKNRNAFQTLLSAAKEAAADAGHDPCRAVRRAGVALAFAIEWRFGGAEGPARALAVAVLACKAEPSFGARADILWDTRDGFRKRGEGDVSLSSAAVASRKWATAAVSSPDGRALAFWTTASLRAATRRSGAETASAATALLHALRGVGGWHDPADAAASAGRVAAVDAILAGAAAMTQSLDQKGNGANPLDDGGEDEAERNERRKRKEERRRAKTEKEERRKIRDARRSKRATDAVAAANEKYEIDHDHELDRGEPSAFDPSAMEPSEMLEGGSEMVLSEGTRVDTSGRDGADLDTAGDANRGTPTGGTSTGGGGGAAKEENEEVGTRDVGDVAFVEPAATEQQVHEVVSAATPAAAPAAVAATAPPPAAAPPLVGVKRERSPSAAPAPNATADTGAAPAPQPAPPPAKKPKLMFSFGAKKETVEAAAVSPLTEGEPRERKEKKEKKEKTEKKEKKEKKEKRNRGE